MIQSRELDALVDEHVMGLKRDFVLKPFEIPFYSTSIEGAWDVMYKMINEGWKFIIFEDDLYFAVSLQKGQKKIHGRALTMTRAICEAALTAAVEV